MERIAITGATGFVGGAVAERLVARGGAVVALARGAGPLPDGVERVVGDLGDPQGLRAWVEGADVVVHCAGLVRSSDPNALERINVDGTAAVLAAAADVPRVVLLSTAGVYGHPGGLVSERSPLRPENPYEQSKAAADALARSVRPGDDLRVLRPTNILGVGHPLDPLVRFLRTVEAGRLITTPQAWANYVSLATVADRVVTAATDDAAPLQIVEEGCSIADLARRGAAAMGATPPGLRLLPAMLGGVAASVGRALRPRSDRAARVAAAVDTTRIESAYRTGSDALDDTLAAMVADYRTRGLL